ncbi:MAG: hypothetical protein ACKOW9_02765 [Candidatus Paceibacterota bacterium]
MEKFDWKNKNLWLGVAALLVVILLIVVISKRRGGEEVADVELTPESAEVVNEAPVQKPIRRRTPVTKETTVPAKLSYADALVKYKDARIQFDAECRAVPGNVTYKDGTEIMLDNRAGVSRTITLGSTFTIGAYGFKIVKVTSNVLPYTYLVDCGDKQNVATILVQR